MGRTNCRLLAALEWSRRTAFSVVMVLVWFIFAMVQAVHKHSQSPRLLCHDVKYSLGMNITNPPGYKNQPVVSHVCRVRSAGPEGRSLQKWNPTSQPSRYKSGTQPDKISQMLVLQTWNSGSRGLTCWHLNLNPMFANLGSPF